MCAEAVWMPSNDARDSGSSAWDGRGYALAPKVSAEIRTQWGLDQMEEAENERMHLMTFMEVAQPKWYERALVVAVQGVFFNAYFLLYIASPRMAHRIVGYLEEEAIHSYTQYLHEIDCGHLPNGPAPAIALDYWQLPQGSTIRDVVEVVRADEAHHRDVNHFAAVCGWNRLDIFVRHSNA